MSVQDLALQRDKYRHLTDEEWRWFLQQVEGRERTADKMPTFAAMEEWWYPVRLSCEQCSSEITARYKAKIIGEWRKAKQSCLEGAKNGESRFVDLTAGYGVDSFFLSRCFDHTDYVERDAELCRIAEHNFKVQSDKVQCTNISVHNTTAEEFLETAGQYDLIFLDPARRDSHGGKVFRLEDCTPDVTKLLPTLVSHLTHEGRILLKLSPMLDITQAVRELSAVSLQWSVYVVAVKNEVKEVLIQGTKYQGQSTMDISAITAIDLDKPEQTFTFTREEEQNCPFTFHLSPFTFLYEPNAAILKAGAYKLVAELFGLQKLDVNTHLYTSETLVADFPGRVWKVKAKGERLMAKGEKANVLVRNYPMTAEQLKKKLRLSDGGDIYVIGCRVAGKPTLFCAERL